MIARLHLPCAIVMRLHVRKINAGNGGHGKCLGSSLSLSVGFYIQDEAMDVARSAPQGAYYHAEAIYLLGCRSSSPFHFLWKANIFHFLIT